MMLTLLLFVVFWLAVCLLNLRYGFDSTPKPQSKEEELARHGVTWEG